MVHHWSEALTRSVYRQIAVDLPTNPMLLNSNVLVIRPHMIRAGIALPLWSVNLFINPVLTQIESVLRLTINFHWHSSTTVIREEASAATVHFVHVDSHLARCYRNFCQPIQL
jgi:hypothetical protein